MQLLCAPKTTVFKRACETLAHAIWFELLSATIVVLNALALGLNWCVPLHPKQPSMCIVPCASCWHVYSRGLQRLADHL
jgi:hypothetical protein